MLLLSEPKAPGGLTFATGNEGTFTEVMDAAWNNGRYAWNANSRWRALEEAYDRRIKAVQEATGQTLDNPLRAVPSADDYREIARRTKASGRALYLPDYMAEKFQSQLARIAEGAPDKLGVLRPHVPVVADAIDLARGSEDKLNDVLSRTSGLTGTLANLAGGVGAAFEDPATYALAPIGLSGSASKSLLWNALRAAASNAGGQAVIEPFIQQWRAEAGLEAGFLPGLKDVAFAGAVGGGLDFAVRGTVRTVKRARGTYQPGVPVPEMERGATIEEAISRLPDDNPIKAAAAGDDAALVVAAQKIEGHLTAAQRGALRQLELDTNMKIDAGEDLAAIAQAIRHAEAPDIEPAPVHTPPAKAAAVEIDPADAVAVRLSEGRGTTIETASVFRERPELIGAVPIEGKTRTARSLARLDEAAFDMVRRGTVKESWGAAVADTVADPAEHAPVLERLAQAQPESLAEARQIIAQETAKPATPKAVAEALGGAEPSRVETTLQQVAHAIQSGTVPAKRAREALKRRIAAGEIDADGPQPAPRGLDEPAGPEAKAEVETKLKERTSRLGKGLKDITAEQTGGQAAVDRVAGRGGRKPAFSLTPKAADALPDVRAKLNEAAALLPKAVRIRLYDRLTFADLPERIQAIAPPGVEERTIAGLWDPEQMIIHLSLSTADPLKTLRHEQVHMMRALGLLSDADYQRLVRHAEKIDARKTYKIDATYGEAIKAQYADKAAAETVLVEETVAHLVAERLAGKPIGGGLDKLLKPIRDFLRKVRDALGLKGLRTVEDVFRTIERGGDAGGQARGDLMFSLDDAEAALGVRLHDADLRDSVAGAARKLSGNVDMQAAWIEGMGLEQGDAEEIVKLYTGFLKDFRKIMDESTAKRLAREEVAKLLETEALHRKRVALLQLEATTRVRAALSTHKNARGEVDPAQAMIGHLEHYGLEGTPITSSVEGKRKAILGQAHARLEEMIWAFRKTGFTGRRMNRAKMENVVRELFDGGSGDAAAKAFADAWTEVSEGLRQRFNRAGGAVGKLEKWGLPQAHDARALRKRGLAQWKADTLALLDPAKMRHPISGQPMSLQQVSDSLDVVYRRIVTDGLVDAPADAAGGGRGALHKQHAEHRFLVFKNADAWMKYQKAYGSGGSEGIFAAMMNHVNIMARDIAAMEVLGPNPGLTLEAMIAFVRKEGMNAVGGLPALFPTKSPIGLPWNPETYATSKIQRARDMWAHMHGSANVPVNGVLANTLSAVRNITFATALGSATLSSLTDLGRQQIHRRFAGVFKTAHTGRDLRAGANPMAVLGDVVQQFKSLNRREAVRAGLILESATHVLHESARYAGGFNGPMWSQVFADRMLTWALLTPWTQANRHVFGLSIMAEVADNVGKRFADLDPGLQTLFGRYGMGAAEWDAIRQFTPSAMGDADAFVRGRQPGADAFPKNPTRSTVRDAGKLMAGAEAGDALDPIRYLKATDIADERLAERYLEMILQETERAVPSGTVANKALWVGQNQPGSFRGELMRSISMLKSYGTIVLMQDWGRVAAEIGRGRKLNGARFMASIVISSTLLGALAMQLKSLSRGEDPRPMDEPEFWGAAMMQGGGMGIYGDYLFGSVNRFGGGFAGSLAGPVTSRASNLWNLTGGNVIQFAQDEPTNLGRESVAFARMNLSMPFYLRLAYERVLLDELQKVADPEAYQAFRRKASKLKSQFKTGYWWAPGETGPRRAPDFGNIAP